MEYIVGRRAAVSGSPAGCGTSPGTGDLAALVLHEWERGLRRREELEAQQALFRRDEAVAFGPREAAIAADLYRRVRRPRGREIDLAIAACAIAHDAAFWTLDPADFQDLPGLRMARVPV